ncbi:MAG: SIS domain-containing protein [Anaerolineaceae bacterium]|nr:SIS domain-containing protein [Anaerolineaceae bacterium]
MEKQNNPAVAYLMAAESILTSLRASQLESLGQAAEICTNTIANDGLVHLFGTGHSRMMIEEMFPRHGSFPGFHPIVELSLTYHNTVVGDNGQRQAMFLEHVEGLSKVILRNFSISEPDSFMIFSNSGVNQVVVEMAIEAKKRNLPVIAVVSVAHCQASRAQHSSGKKLIDFADVVVDNCSPAGDAMVRVQGLEDPVGPGSTIGGAAVVNAIKCLVAENLTNFGKPPIVLTSSYFIGEEKSARQFERCYDDYRTRIQRTFGCGDNSVQDSDPDIKSFV